jgi:hypothetical protein
MPQRKPGSDQAAADDLATSGLPRTYLNATLKPQTESGGAAVPSGLDAANPDPTESERRSVDIIVVLNPDESKGNFFGVALFFGNTDAGHAEALDRHPHVLIQRVAGAIKNGNPHHVLAPPFRLFRLFNYWASQEKSGTFGTNRLIS